jgi:hypothetical protein
MNLTDDVPDRDPRRPRRLQSDRGGWSMERSERTYNIDKTYTKWLTPRV